MTERPSDAPEQHTAASFSAPTEKTDTPPNENTNVLNPGSQMPEGKAKPTSARKPAPRRATPPVRGKAALKRTSLEASDPASKDATQNLPEPQSAESDNARYNLHRQTDLWPEAWPEVSANNGQVAAPAFGGSVSEISSPEPAPNTLEEPEQDAPLPLWPENFTERKPEAKKPAKPLEKRTGSAKKSSSSRPKDMPANVKKNTGKEESANTDDKKNSEKGVDKKPAAAESGKKTKAVKPQQPSKHKRVMFISALPGEQIEVVITEDGKVSEYYVQMLHQLKSKGNIYKATIHNIDANLQAAFVAYGAQKNGFLQIDEVHPEYYLAPHEPNKNRRFPLIQKVLKAGQEVLVQVIKEPTGGKGAFLSTYLSLPGRFLVLTPGRSQLGVSRKVEDETDRERLRKVLDTLPVGDGLGIIVRTASLSASKTSLLKDLQFLKRLWKEVRTRGGSDPAPSLIYEEPSLASRAVRDYLTDDIAEIWVDDEDIAKEIEETVNLIAPRRLSSTQIKLHASTQKSLWEAFNLQEQLDQIYSREVTLPSGGRLVFDQTEALMSIDINSGKIAGRNNFESMALRTNIEAAEAIAQQLRLRDIGGQIVIDFIEMREHSHWRELEKVMRNAMKGDRARYDVAKVGPFGLMEVVRQRLGSSSISVTMEPCPCCAGTGLRRNIEWQALRALRDIQYKLNQKTDLPEGEALVYEAENELALYLLNNKRNALLDLEQRFGTHIIIEACQGKYLSCKN